VLRLLICAGVLCVLAAGAGLAAAVDVRAPQEKAAALQRLVSVATTGSSTPAASPSEAGQPIPARLLGSGAPVPIPPSVLQVRNAWLVSDGRTLVAVYAGADGNDPTVGRLVIVRQDLVAGTQTVRTLDAGPTGALAIAVAPRGRSVETSAQSGSIELRTAGARTLRLDLATSTVGSG
jgi:hypothetical protein